MKPELGDPTVAYAKNGRKIGSREHLGRLKAVLPAYQKILHVRGNLGRRAAAVDVAVGRVSS